MAICKCDPGEGLVARGSRVAAGEERLVVLAGENFGVARCRSLDAAAAADEGLNKPWR
jgi:hypothetical protein